MAAEGVHRISVPVDLKGFFNTPFLSDLKVVLDDGTEILCHRLVLAAQSGFFKAAFVNGYREASEQQMSIHLGNHRNVGHDVLRFMYTGTMDMDADSVVWILAWAQFLQISGLERLAIEYLLSLPPSSAPTLLRHAIDLHLDDLAYELEGTIARHLFEIDRDAIVQSGFDLQGMLSILRHPHVTVESETTVYQTVCKYIEMARNMRMETLHESHEFHDRDNEQEHLQQEQQPTAESEAGASLIHSLNDTDDVQLTTTKIGLSQREIEALFREVKFERLAVEDLETALLNPDIPKGFVVDGLVKRLKLLESPSTTHNVERPRHIVPVHVPYRASENAEAKGLIHYLGCKATGRFENPHRSSIVTVRMSSYRVGNPEDIVSQMKRSVSTKFEVGPFVSIDFGPCRLVKPSFYQLQYCIADGSFRNWLLQGSKDGNTWDTICTHTNDTSFQTNVFGIKAWPVVCDKAYRMLRVFHPETGQLQIGGIEFFGCMFEYPSPPQSISLLKRASSPMKDDVSNFF